MSADTTVTAGPDRVDARVVRFTASATAAVLAAVLLLANVDTRAAMGLLAAQGVVFAIGAIRGPARHPYGLIFRRFFADQRGAASKTEAVEQIRFAQFLGFVFCTVGVVGFALGSSGVALGATGFALFAALMRAVFGVCISRGPYMLFCRLQGRVPACCQNK